MLATFLAEMRGQNNLAIQEDSELFRHRFRLFVRKPGE